MSQLQFHTQLGALREPTIRVFRIRSLPVKGDARVMGERGLIAMPPVFLDLVWIINITSYCTASGHFLPVLDFFTIQGCQEKT